MKLTAMDCKLLALRIVGIFESKFFRKGKRIFIDYFFAVNFPCAAS
jgi:hypothetical protein